jgi:hypothetical protein
MSYFVVDCIGKSGGLALMWKNEMKAQIQNYSQRHINAILQCGSSATEWKFTGFYGNPEVAKRPEAWALLRHLSKLLPDPWLCLGDFNEIISETEKSSSSVWPRRQMSAFKQALDEWGLYDLGFIGPRYTWCNGRSGGNHTERDLTELWRPEDGVLYLMVFW